MGCLEEVFFDGRAVAVLRPSKSSVVRDRLLNWSFCVFFFVHCHGNNHRYRKMALKYHPDKNKEKGAEEVSGLRGAQIADDCAKWIVY